MSAKIVTGYTRQRIVLPDFRMEKIIGWDADNSYPQRVIDLIAASGTASACVRTYKRFIKGSGFADMSQQVKYGKLLESISDDKAKLGTFAIHVQYNGFGEVVKLTHVPVEYCRIGTDGLIAVYDNWDKRSLRKPYNANDIKRFPYYNPAKFFDELEDLYEGDINQHPGQILWVKPDDKEYPIAPCDPVLKDIRTDGSIQEFKNKNIRTNFMASHLYVHKGRFENELERHMAIENLERFQGAETVGNIMMIEVEDESQIPELRPFTIQNNDKLFEFTEKSIMQNIHQAYGIHPFLTGLASEGSLGTGTAIGVAHAIFNEYVTDDRKEIQDAMMLLIGEPVQILELQTNIQNLIQNAPATRQGEN